MARTTFRGSLVLFLCTLAATASAQFTPAEELVIKGIDLAAVDKFELAIDHFSRAIQIDPSCAWAYSSRGSVYAEFGKFDEAFQDVEKLEKLDKFSAGKLRIDIAVHQGDLAKALELANDLVNRYPRTASSYEERAYVRSRAGQLDEMEADFDRAIDLWGDHIRSNSYSARARQFHFHKKYGKAIRDCTLAISSAPPGAASIPYYYFDRGKVYLDMGKFDEAIRDFSTSLKDKPLWANNYHYRAAAYRFQGKNQKAEEDERRAYQLNPEITKFKVKRPDSKGDASEREF